MGILLLVPMCIAQHPAIALAFTPSRLNLRGRICPQQSRPHDFLPHVRTHGNISFIHSWHSFGNTVKSLSTIYLIVIGEVDCFVQAIVVHECPTRCVVPRNGISETARRIGPQICRVSLWHRVRVGAPPSYDTGGEQAGDAGG